MTQAFNQTENNASEPIPPCVVASVCYVKGQPPRPISIDQIQPALQNDDVLIWVGLHDPSLDVITEHIHAFGLDSEVIDELMAPHAMPKMIDYDDCVYVVAQTVELNETLARPHFGSVALVFTDKIFLTVRFGAVLGHRALRLRLEKLRGRLEKGGDFVAVHLLEFLVDHYLQTYLAFEQKVVRMEHQLIAGRLDSVHIRHLYTLRRDFQRFQNAIEPLGEVCVRLSQIQIDQIKSDTQKRFLALSERIARLDRLLDNVSAGLSFAFEAGMLNEQARQTDTTRKLAAWAAIISVPTAFAGIYGMNFIDIPELHWKYSYPTFWGVMMATCTTLYFRFKRAKWL